MMKRTLIQTTVVLVAAALMIAAIIDVCGMNFHTWDSFTWFGGVFLVLFFSAMAYTVVAD